MRLRSAHRHKVRDERVAVGVQVGRVVLAHAHLLVVRRRAVPVAVLLVQAVSVAS